MRILLTAFLLVLLTACGPVGLEPSIQMVQKAIAFQIGLTQKQLTQQLYASESPQPARFEITRLTIQEQEKLVMQNLPTYHIRGVYNVSIKFPRGWVNQQQSPFEVYLQRQVEGKTWRIIIPQSDGKEINPIWRSYLLK